MSKPSFFRRGLTTAFLKSCGKQPEARDLLNSNAMNGDNQDFMSFISHVGTGSSWQVLHGADEISLSTSAMVKGVQRSSVGVSLWRTSCGGMLYAVYSSQAQISPASYVFMSYSVSSAYTLNFPHAVFRIHSVCFLGFRCCFEVAQNECFVNFDLRGCIKGEAWCVSTGWHKVGNLACKTLHQTHR